MTQDFRQPSSSSTTGATPGPASPGQPALAPQQTLVLSLIQMSGFGFLLGALFVVVGEPEVIPADIRPYLAFSLAVAGVADILVVRLLRRTWTRQARR